MSAVTTQVVTFLAVLGGLSGAIWAVFRGMALWRAGTSGRQQNLMARYEREINRLAHDRDQHETRYRAAYDHIRREEHRHLRCGVESSVFEPPRWEPYRDEPYRAEREGTLVETTDE